MVLTGHTCAKADPHGNFALRSGWVSAWFRIFDRWTVRDLRLGTRNPVPTRCAVKSILHVGVARSTESRLAKSKRIAVRTAEPSDYFYTTINIAARLAAAAVGI
eukprot:COSAG02_NODE_14308_length_1286_cov_2.831047_2_plen_104_part_00